MTIFEKIVARDVPADIIYEDDEIIAFRDVAPQAPVHVLIVPKKVVRNIGAADASDDGLLGRLLLASKRIAEQTTILNSGYRLVINHGKDAGESVPHLHVHLLGGRTLAWPPG